MSPSERLDYFYRLLTKLIHISGYAVALTGDVVKAYTLNLNNYIMHLPIIL